MLFFFSPSIYSSYFGNFTRKLILFYRKRARKVEIKENLKNCTASINSSIQSRPAKKTNHKNNEEIFKEKERRKNGSKKSLRNGKYTVLICKCYLGMKFNKKSNFNKITLNLFMPKMKIGFNLGLFLLFS